jgi:hypothetical protein
MQIASIPELAKQQQKHDRLSPLRSKLKRISQLQVGASQEALQRHLVKLAKWKYQLRQSPRQQTPAAEYAWPHN